MQPVMPGNCPMEWKSSITAWYSAAAGKCTSLLKSTLLMSVVTLLTVRQTVG